MSTGQSPATYHIRESGSRGQQIYFPIGTIPALGFGTWKNKGDEGATAVYEAVKTGYRHIDCAEAYDNQADIGKGIRRALDEMKGTVRRSDLFICSKLWNTHHDPKDVEGSLKRILKDLQIEYLDLFLMHWPVAFKKSSDNFPKDAKGNIQEVQVPLIDTWRAMEQLLMMGLVKHIGVSNFTIEQLEELWKDARIKPVAIQVEGQPYLDQTRLQEAAKEKGMIFVAYSPLGQYAEGQEKPIEDEVVLKVARKYKKSPAQVLLRWQIDSGRVVLTKSSTPERIRENFQIWDFELTDDEINQINALGDKNVRTCNPEFKKGNQPVFEDAPATTAS